MHIEIKKLRKELHRHPELSGHECNTAKRIKNFIETHHKTKIIEDIGGNGLAAMYAYAEKGPSIMIRCELDALLIKEEKIFDYHSRTEGVSHKCGHDGHMAIVAGLIFWIKEQDFKTGKIILLFQPAEETGEGAYKVLHDPKFKSLNPDYIFTLHNIPGEPLNSIIFKEDIFSATVQSLTIYLSGKESHAAEPDKGINPTLGISQIINEFSGLNMNDSNDEDFSILTPIHINMGEKSYGVSPAKGELHYTIRTWTEESMKRLKQQMNAILRRICHDHKLEFRIEWFEYFPAINNDKSCNELIINAAKKNGFDLIERLDPFKFGEDFGWFSQNHKAAMFGVGAGIDSPALHSADYDFPDEIIETGLQMFQTIIKEKLTRSYKS